MPDPNSIRIKRSNTTTNTPSSLLNGELASNISDQKLWIGNSSNTPILLSDITNTFVNQGAWDYNAAYNKNTVVTYAGIFYYSVSAVPPYQTSPNINTTYWAILSDPSGSSGSYLPLAGGAMTGSITSVGTTHDTEVAGDFFGVQLSADNTQGTMLNFDGLDTYNGASHMKVTPTGLTFPDSTTQTTGLVIGTNVQAWNADLDAIAAIAGTTGLLKKTAANTWSLDTATYLTGNQNITLSGDVSGSGTTAITTTLATVPITKGGTGQITATAAVNALLPSQTGNSGKYLTTNGTDSSWGTVASGSTIPIGAIMPYAGSSAPSGGYLICDGSSVSSSNYLALHAVISNTYGGLSYTGAAGRSFNLPDLRSRVPIGVGQGSGLTNRTLGGTIGAENETAPLPYHNHNNTVGSSAGGSNGITNTMNQSNPHAHLNAVRAGSTGGNYYRIYDRFANESNTLYTENTDINHTHNIGINNAYAGSGGTHNNMQPSIGLNFIIKT